ncbi:prepilin-type N-terminal cleavage/methylation domain-containing protein [Teredinibacter turnerae]|uniref:prepilin-type N-terminal cleavage/methylation domain-containing protein n=1 Tax=Teredinibacter turnerae TaxID=2426 RepID=UPI00048EB514|nr:prepilin-type N-terminal cleavage/methylation domain-containing protein [Teredinibacter turnerae]
MRSNGFSLVELVAILVIVGVIAAATVRSRSPTTSMELQAGRDSLVAAMHSAQQIAMTRAHNTVLIAGTTIDLRIDTDGDGEFSDETSLAYAGVTYPISFPAGVVLSSGCGASPVSFVFNRLGQTSGCRLTLAKAAGSVAIEVAASGFVR